MKKMKRVVLEDPPQTEGEVDGELDEGEEEIDGEGDDEEEDLEDDEEDEEEDEGEDGEEDEEEDEDEEEEEEESFSGYRSPAHSRGAPHRPRRGFLSDEGDDELSDEMAAAIRAGKYKPKRQDPWTAHTLYSMLKDLGKL